MLPFSGEILVKRGQTVQASQVVARAEVPEHYQVVNIARQLAQPEVDMGEALQKAVGDAVEANEVIAVLKGRLSFLQRTARVPVAGVIASIGPGWVLIETERTVVEMQAFINGTVTGIIPERGVVIGGQGALIEAACGFGGETQGRLNRLVGSPSDILEESAFEGDFKDDIVVVGRSIDEDLLRLAEEKQVRGLIVGSIDATLLTLDPPSTVCVIATEGFGDIPMSPYTFGHLTALNGRQVSVRGQTLGVTTGPTRDAALSPVILATSERSITSSDSPPKQSDSIGIGSRVRVTRGRFLGVIGEVNALSPEPQATDIGLRVPGTYVTLDNASHYIPWVNLEQVN